KKNKKKSNGVMKKQWELDAEGALHIQAGRRLYLGGLCSVSAVDIPEEDGEPAVVWVHQVAGTPAAMAAADGRLFVSLAEGLIYCFGAEVRKVTLPEVPWMQAVPRGAMWRYLDDGSAPGASWRSPDFDDRGWRAGPAQFGYGEKDEATVVSFGDDKKNKHITTYFRHAFDVRAGGALESMRLGVLVDDGAVVYINGVEIGRIEMGKGPVNHLTPASGAAREGVYKQIDLEPDALLPGRNVLAVEVHQADGSSSDLSFDLALAVEKRLPEPPPPPAPKADEATLEARRILRRTDVREGYCLVLGLDTGRLAEELARQSGLHVVAVDADAEKVAAARARLDAAGLYGHRVAILHAKESEAALPPYMASLVVSEALGAVNGDSVERMFHALRPYGGAACLRVPETARESFAKCVANTKLENADLDLSGDYLVLRRVGALPGAADWTHQYGDVANTVVSRDSRVKAPLGLLWFGGSSNRTVLPRHGHGPSEQVVGGRIFIEGADSLRAMDVYTGRVLWERELPGLGAPYDSTSHQPGANAVGSNYASAQDAVYVAYGPKLLRLDPATGATAAEFALPTSLAPTPPLVSYLGVYEDLLVVGGMPLSYDADIGFGIRHLAKAKTDALEEAAEWFRDLKGFKLVSPKPIAPEPPDRKAKDKKKDAAEKARRAKLIAFVVENANRLLAERDVASMLALDEKALAKTKAVREDIAIRLRSGADRMDLRRSLPALNRTFLEQVRWPMPRKQRAFGASDVWSGSASKWLLAMNRHTGNVLWARFAAHGFHHNAIAIGGGRVFCVDRLPVPLLTALRRRGEEPHASARLLAVGVRTGEVLWSTGENIFGTWLGYAAERDILLLGARASRDMLDEPGDRMTAYRGKSGGVVWDVERKYSGPCMLHGDTIFTQGAAFSLLTGEARMRRNPVTGAEALWTFTRNYGCNTVIASEHLLTFRSAAAGFYDLATDSGTANLGGFKSGCTSNLIVANGVLNAPDYTRTCVCSYHNQTSLAFVHDPDVEQWTFNALKLDGAPVRRLGLNLGAPGDRMADAGTLWIECPIVGGPSPDVRVAFDPKKPKTFQRHISWVDKKAKLPWVVASGVVGAKSVTVTLRKAVADEALPYTVRLVFLEPEALKAGERVFDVSIQGKAVLPGLDIVKVAKGPGREVVREFRSVLVKENLTIALEPTGERPAVLCGIEVLAQGW
ncbi:hypothetical protein HQ560_07250, partial [bacterium]|nr:hypothetical protein [bacterium]